MKSRWKVLVLGVGITAGVLAGCRRSESPEAATPGSQASRQARQHPPFGLIDTPREGDSVASGSQGSGWALDDSGVAKVEVSLDNAPAVPGELGQPFPGVREAYPTYPDSDKAGFSFTMPSVAAGPHLLIVTITGKDGGKTDLRRHIQIQ